MIVFKLPWGIGSSIVRKKEYSQLVHRVEEGSGWLLSERTKQVLERQGLLRAKHRSSITQVDIQQSDWRTAGQGLIYDWVASISGALPEEVVREVILWLHARPGIQIEFMGRGRFTGRAPAEDELLYFDIAAGRRAYAFRIRNAPLGQLDARAARVQDDFSKIGHWASDRSARVVLSIGGGGYRLFAAQSAVKVVERVFGGDRSKIHEVWGSSGGALLAYVFANGHDLSVIDRLGYDLYHGRRKDLPGIHVRSLVNLSSRLVSDWASNRIGSPELGAWVEAVDQMCPPADRGPARVPYYAFVSNPRWRYPVAFSEPQFIPAYCHDFLIPCGSGAATAASMAVPFLFRPLRGVRDFEDDRWFDGSVVEENPIMLPFVKWLRDRKANPTETPERLKLVLVNLNMRFSESSLLSSVSAGPFLTVMKFVRRAVDLVDLLLDSKTHALIRTLSEVGDVEIMSATLTLGRLSFITRKDIPAMMRTGQIIEGWRLEAHAHGNQGVSSLRIGV